jgi:hypothetical protein
VVDEISKIKMMMMIIIIIIISYHYCDNNIMEDGAFGRVGGKDKTV